MVWISSFSPLCSFSYSLLKTVTAQNTANKIIFIYDRICKVQSELKPAQLTSTLSSPSLIPEAANFFACAQEKCTYSKATCNHVTVRNSSVDINTNLFYLFSGSGELCVKGSVSVYTPVHMCFPTREHVCMRRLATC